MLTKLSELRAELLTYFELQEH